MIWLWLIPLIWATIGFVLYGFYYAYLEDRYGKPDESSAFTHTIRKDHRRTAFCTALFGPVGPLIVSRGDLWWRFGWRLW